METTDYIIPTTKKPVFVASCSAFGYIARRMYKDWHVPTLHMVGETFDIHFADAVNALHEWIVDNKEILDEYPTCKFVIESITGKEGKYGEAEHTNVYSISAWKAKKYLL